MASTAILFGNANYLRENPLPCCIDDVAAIEALITATGRFDAIHAHTDLDADAMRDVIRTALPAEEGQDEIFFYFSGHGMKLRNDFYFCGTQFDSSHPNETGLSHSQLHELLRAAAPDLLVNLIDACFSGTLLIKGDRSPWPIAKEGFRNVVQIASSLESQTSMGGEPLSIFTKAFLEAAVRKSEGPVFYTDVVGMLRDSFFDNDDQTPHFISQGTGRETLIDNVTKLAGFKEQLISRWSAPADDVEQGGRAADSAIVLTEPLTPKELLTVAEGQMGSSSDAKRQSDELFNVMIARWDASAFGDFFDTIIVEHSSYNEATIEEFMVRVLAREPRSDELVTAKITQEEKRKDPWDMMMASTIWATPQEWVERLDLELNCRLDRAQLRLTLMPKYRALQQLVLVLSFAPSLEHCYIFEMITQHRRTDWNTFDSDGNELVRRWYKRDWAASTGDLPDQICAALEKAARDHIATVTNRLATS